MFDWVATSGMNEKRFQCLVGRVAKLSQEKKTLEEICEITGKPDYMIIDILEIIQKADKAREAAN